MYWDNSDKPSVAVTLGDFFASAEYQSYAPVNSLAVCVNPAGGFNCYWDIPFYKNFRIILENLDSEVIYVYYQIDYIETELEAGYGYFHAQFRRTNPLPYKEVYTILDNVQGKGHYIGTYIFWGVNNNGWWGEGEIKFYLDGDREYPTICGNGTEDYFCGAYCFDVGGKYMEYNTAYAGLNKITKEDGAYNSNLRISMYRWHLNDPVYFKKDIKITIQALGWRSGGRYLPLQDDISSVAYWYSDNLNDVYPALPDANALEII